MIKRLFITGTDTDVGKTYISSLILKSLNREQLLTCGFKPIASGGIKVMQAGNHMETLLNSDALILQQNSSLQLPCRIVNPYCFEPAIAPHVAAAEAGVKLSIALLDQAFEKVKQAYPIKMDKIVRLPADGDPVPLHQPHIILSEGAGGWHVPLNEQERLSDWVAGQQMGVILVVGLKLGCINHALLSCEAIKNAGLPLLGWIANRPVAEPMSREVATVAYLKAAISAPLIADVAFSNDPQHTHLDENAHQAVMRVMPAA